MEPQPAWDASKEVALAAKRIETYAVYTPLRYSEHLSELTGSEVYLKCENLQETGSFKFRGAMNKVASIREKGPASKVAGASNGNHGLAVAAAAAKFGMQAVIFLSSAATATREERIRSIGAEVRRTAGGCEEAEASARAFAAAEGLPYVSPYNDHDVVAGQGTIALEILAQLGRLPDQVFVAVGGGGLIGGVGAALAGKGDCSVVGCWAENSPVMYECIKKGQIFDVDEQPTISSSTSGGIEAGSVTFPICQEVITGFALVSETEIESAMALVKEHEDQIVEGAAGVAVAGLLRSKSQAAGKLNVVILCGGNL